MVAVVIFSVVIMSLVGLSFQVARHSTRSTDQALSMAALLAKMDRVSTTAFDSLPSLTGCDTTVSGLVKVVGCITTATLSPVLDSIRIVVQTTLPGARPDTLTLQRGKQSSAVPLR